jgi:uncharacterized membrane protein (TIGR02234 family)
VRHVPDQPDTDRPTTRRSDPEPSTEQRSAGGQPVDSRPVRPGMRPLWTVIVLLALGAGALWLASRLTWAWSRELTPLRGTVVVTQDGAHVSTALVPLALLALAAVAAVLAIGGWWRRLVGVLVAIAGAAGVWVGAHTLPAVFGTHPNGYPRSQVVTGHVVAALAGLLIVAAGVLVVRDAARMPRLGGNYQTPSAARRRSDPDTELWQALSEGRDPTAND